MLTAIALYAAIGLIVILDGDYRRGE